MSGPIRATERCGCRWTRRYERSSGLDPFVSLSTTVFDDLGATHGADLDPFVSLRISLPSTHDSGLDDARGLRLDRFVPPRITVVDPWHWLTETGAFPPDPRLRARALRVAQCIEAGGSIPRNHTRETLVPCRRRPGGEACTGFLWVVRQGDDTLHAFCPTCHADEFLIHNWEDTPWAEGPMEPMPVQSVFEITGAGR